MTRTSSEYHNGRIRVIVSLQHAQEYELSFLANPKLQDQLHETRAAAVFLRAEDLKALKQAGIQYSFLPILCESPYFAYALLAQWFVQFRLRQLSEANQPSAHIHPSAQLSQEEHIGTLLVIETY